jgi:hypothetical protein
MRADYFLPGFFLPATVRLGPLRVRAFVLVRYAPADDGDAEI